MWTRIYNNRFYFCELLPFIISAAMYHFQHVSHACTSRHICHSDFNIVRIVIEFGFLQPLAWTLYLEIKEYDKL